MLPVSMPQKMWSGKEEKEETIQPRDDLKQKCGVIRLLFYFIFIKISLPAVMIS